jgi:hypothetical protein
VPFAMGWWKWIMLSAQKFFGTDLQIEMVATQIDGFYIGFSYVYYQVPHIVVDVRMLLWLVVN